MNRSRSAMTKQLLYGFLQFGLGALYVFVQAYLMGFLTGAYSKHAALSEGESFLHFYDSNYVNPGNCTNSACPSDGTFSILRLLKDSASINTDGLSGVCLGLVFSIALVIVEGLSGVPDEAVGFCGLLKLCASTFFLVLFGGPLAVGIGAPIAAHRMGPLLGKRDACCGFKKHTALDWSARDISSKSALPDEWLGLFAGINHWDGFEGPCWTNFLLGPGGLIICNGLLLICYVLCSELVSGLYSRIDSVEEERTPLFNQDSVDLNEASNRLRATVEHHDIPLCQDSCHL